MLAWSGNPANLPPGYQLCDGTNGTPDLRDRFVVGVGNYEQLGDTGGTITNSTYHSHTVSGGVHTHDIVTQTIRRGLFARVVVVTSLEASGAHEHTTDLQGDILDNRPPYYALYYVCAPALPDIDISASSPYTFTTTSGAVVEIERRFTYADIVIISLLVFIAFNVVLFITWSAIRKD